MSATHRHHPVFARFYEHVSPAMDRGGLAQHRATLLRGLSGRVIEVGAGNGLNFTHYPPEVTRVLAVEPEPHLRRVATTKAEDASVPVDVVDGVAEQLRGTDGSFDAGVVSLVLCTVPDPVQALRELYRAIRPGGELRFLEHVRADTSGLRRAQRFLDATVGPILGGGCNASRDTQAAIENAGFRIGDIRHLRFPEGRVPLPTSPHILGVAHRP